MRRMLLCSIVLAIFVSCGSGASGQRAFSELPNDFEVTERVVSFTTTFDITSANQNYATVAQSMLSLTRSFSLKDTNGKLLSTAKARFLSWGTHIDVFDGSGQLIGGIKEEVLKSFFKTYTTYMILDASGRVVATSEKLEFLGTEITLYGNTGAVVATLQRPWFNLFRDTWNVSIKNRSAVDVRVLVVIGAYKTAVDNERRKEKESEK